MSLVPYWSDDRCSLYLGDCREILPALGVTADLVLADPPYQCTPLTWDRWPDGWLAVAAQVTASMWCFGSLRMFLQRGGEFAAAGWKLSHDAECEWVDHAVWEKGNGSGPSTRDRLRRVHELAAHWYRGPWAAIHHDVPVVAASAASIARNGHASRGHTSLAHQGEYGTRRGWTDDGTRYARSVIRASTMRGRAIHPCEKPAEILAPLLAYGCPPGGLVVDPFAGSCSTLMAARITGMRSIGIEADEGACEKAVKLRLAQGDLLGGEVA